MIALTHQRELHIILGKMKVKQVWLLLTAISVLLTLHPAKTNIAPNLEVISPVKNSFASQLHPEKTSASLSLKKPSLVLTMYLKLSNFYTPLR